MSRGEALSALPSAARALMGSSINSIFGFDGGQSRKINDCTLDTRTGHFSNWLDHINPPLISPLGQGVETVNLTLAAYGQGVGEGNSLEGAKIVAATVAAYLTATDTLLEYHVMDDPSRLTRSGQPRQKSHPLLACILDQHKLMCVEPRMRQPITRDKIDIMMWL
jgi:hypothetical protein